MRWIILLLILLVLVNTASAVIRDDASVLLINSKEAKFMIINHGENGYESKLLQTSKFYDWKRLALADIDGDNYNELIVMRDIGEDFYIYDYIDNELVQQTDPKSIGSFSSDLSWVKPIALDIDKDKADELIIVNNKYGRFYSLDKQGSEYKISPIGETMVKDWISMASADIDGDGEQEIILLRRSAKPIYIFDYANGRISTLEEAKKIGDSIGDISIDTMAVGDLDGDKKPEVIVASAYQKKLYSVSYTNMVTIISSLSYSKVDDMEIADVDNDGKNELIILSPTRNPVSIYKFYGESLSETIVQSLIGDTGWIGITAGKFTNEVAETPVSKVEEKTEEVPTPEVTEPITVNETVKEETKTNYLNYFLVIIILACLGVIAYLVFKYMPKSEDKEEKSSKNNDKVYLNSEDKDSMWPVSKRSKDIKELKEFVKKTKK